MNYRKLNHLISPFLAQQVEAIYELVSGDHEQFYKTIPNGIIGLTVLVEGSAWTMDDSNWEAVQKTSLYGMIKSPSLIKVSKNCRDISIVFNPVFFAALLKVPMYLISNRFTNAADLFMKHDLGELEESFSAALSDKEIINAAEKFLLKYRDKEVDRTLLSAYQKISTVSYNRVSDLSLDLNISSRTLLNRFNDKIGLSPKELMRIFRINSALDIKKHMPQNLTDLAFKLGYFDQAHFIHDFKQTLGITPEQYFKNDLLISDFYNSERWNLS